MTISLTSNFFANARGLTFLDTTSVTWSINKNTNQITAAVAGTPSGANPSASVGLAAIDGTALTFMRSDGAPALDVTISPTWSGDHTFSNAIGVSAGGTSIKGALTIAAPVAGVAALNVTGIAGVNIPVMNIFGSTTAGQSNGLFIYAGVGSSSDRVLDVLNQAQNVRLFGVFGDGSFSFSGKGVVNGALGVNGNAAPAQSTGWGTPTGGSVQNNYTAGVGATLLSTSDAVAQIITVLKQVGIFGA